MRIVLDTNVLVSGTLSGAGAPGEVLQLILQGELQLLTDARIIAEYDEVAARPRFAFDPLERYMLMRTLSDISLACIATPFRGKLPDPDDRMFVEVAIGGPADALVTGNTRHFPLARHRPGFSVLTPRQLIDTLR